MALFNNVKVMKIFRVYLATSLIFGYDCDNSPGPTTHAIIKELGDENSTSDSQTEWLSTQENYPTGSDVSERLETENISTTDLIPVSPEDSAGTVSTISVQYDDNGIIEIDKAEEKYHLTASTTPLSDSSDSAETTGSDVPDTSAGTSQSDNVITEGEKLQNTTPFTTSPITDEEYITNKQETNQFSHSFTRFQLFTDSRGTTGLYDTDTSSSNSFENTPFQNTEEIFYSETTEMSNVTDELTDIGDASSEVQFWNDCKNIIVILCCAFVVVLLLVSLICLYGIWRIRKTWRQKLQEEKCKTDIWSMESMNNTIVNENYQDFKDVELRKEEHKHMRQSASSSSTANSDTRMSSAVATTKRPSAKTSEAESTKRSFLGQMGARASHILPPKLFVGRSKSSYDTDVTLVHDPDSRSRSSTFTHGRRKKAGHDKNHLVENIEAEEGTQGILESVDKVLETQNKHIVTEL